MGRNRTALNRALRWWHPDAQFRLSIAGSCLTEEGLQLNIGMHIPITVYDIHEIVRSNSKPKFRKRGASPHPPCHRRFPGCGGERDRAETQNFHPSGGAEPPP